MDVIEYVRSNTIFLMEDNQKPSNDLFGLKEAPLPFYSQYIYETSLTRGLNQLEHKIIGRVNVLNKMNWFIASLTQTTAYYYKNVYSFSGLQAANVSREDQGLGGQNTFLTIEIRSSNLEDNLTYTRVDLAGLLATIGGLMYTCRHIGHKLTAAPSMFAFDATMSRKLYSVGADEHEMFDQRSKKELTQPEDALLSNYIDNRTSFYYSRKMCLRRKLSKCWCCCCCFCFNRKPSVMDRISDRAATRLY